jgi:hypothetical protein
MNNENREQQMMAAAEAYAAEIYKDEPDNFHTDEQLCETINDFCAGWRDADNSRWIPVEEELPPASCGVISDPVLVFIGNNTGWCGYIREGFYNHAAKEWSYMNRGRTHKVTHWMEIQPPRKEE